MKHNAAPCLSSLHSVTFPATPRLFATLTLLTALSLAAVPAAAQPSFTKTFVPDTIGPGSVSTLRFNITNGSGSPVTLLDFSDTLPAGVSIATPANATSTCGGMAILTAPDGGTTISFTDGDVAGSSSCAVTVDVTSSTVGVHTNLSGDLTSSAGNSGTATDDLTVSASRPGFSKSFSPSSVAFGARSTLTFTIDNSANPSLAASISFVDNLPTGMVIADPSNATTDCGSPTLTATTGTSTINLLGSFLLSGATCTVSVDVIAGGTGQLVNSSGELTSTPGGPPVSSGKANAALDVTVSAIPFVKSFLADPVNPGGTVDLEFTITNTDRNNSATGVAFTDSLDTTLTGLAPSGALPAAPCGAGSTLAFAGGTLSLSGGTLPADSFCTFTVSLLVPGTSVAGAYLNTTSALTATLGGSPFVGDAASDTLFVNDAPVLTKTFLSDPVGGGDTVSVEFTITNSSSTSAATDIAFQDNLDAFLNGVTVSALPAAGFCGAGSTIFTFLSNGTLFLSMIGGNLAASDSCTFTVDLTIPLGTPAGTYTNTTDPISATVDGTTQTGQPATDTLTVVAAPVLRKEFTDDPVLPGGTVTLEFVLSHDMNAPADATGIAFTDDLDAALSGLTALGLPVAGCGGTLGGTPANLSFTGGSLMPGETCTLSVTLQVPAAALPGLYTNTTSNVMATVSGVATTGNPAQDGLIVAGLTLSKSFTDDPVIPGETVTLEFTLDNTNSALDATGIFFTDSLSTTLTGLAVSGALPAAPCGGTISGTTFLIFVGGSVTAGTSCSFSVTLLVPGTAADGAYGNTTSSLTATVGGSVVVLPPASDVLVVDSDLLFLTKSFTDDPVVPGGTVTLEFTLTNLDTTQAAAAIAFSDDLDAALTGLTATSTLFDDCGFTIGLGGNVTLTGGSLAAGATCTVRLAVQVPAVVASGSTVTNTTSAVTGTIGGLPVTGGAASDDLEIDLLTFTKAFSGPTTATGTPTLTFTIVNQSTTATVSSLSFSDDLDAVISGLVATGLPMTGDCGASSQISGTSFLTFTDGSLLPSGSCSIVVSLQVPVTATAGTFPNTTSDLFQSGLPVASPATAMLTVEPPPTFAKSFAPMAVVAGGTSTLTFTIDNTASTLAASALDFSDNLPAGVVVSAAPNASTTCAGGTLTAMAGTGTITYTGGTVAAAASCTVTVDVTASVAGAQVNTTGDLTSSSGNSGTASDTLTVTPAPVPVFSKSFAPTTIATGGVSTLTLTIDNTAALLAATALDFTDNFPAGLLVATPANASTTCGGTLTAVDGSGSVSLTGGAVGTGAVCTVSVDVTSAVAGVYVNTTGNLTSSLGDSGTASDTLTVEPPPAFTKSFAPLSVVAGGTSTLTFTIDNSASTLAASALDFTDNLPAGVIVSAVPNASINCTGGTLNAMAGTGVVSYSGGTVAAAASCTLTVDVTASVVGAQVNTTGDLTSSSGNSGPATATLTVTAAPVPVFTKVFAPDSVAAGATSTLTLTIDNTAALLPADALDFTDNLPAGVVVATPSNASTTCTGGTLTAADGSGTVTYTGGTVAAGASCAVSVDVTSAAAGVYVNTTGDLTSSLGNSGTASDTLTVATAPLPTLSVEFVPDAILPGSVSFLVLSIDNTAALIPATALDITSVLPAGLEVASPENATTTCTGGTLTAVGGTDTVTYTGGTVGAGSVCTVQVAVTAPVAGTYDLTTGDLTSSSGNSGTASGTLLVSSAATDIPTLGTWGLLLLISLLGLYGVRRLRASPAGE